MKVLFVMTARGGSKGVPRKNIIQIGKYPLLAYKLISAQKCKYDHRIIISTDDEEIATIAQQYGAEVPFLRPKELASDTAGSMSVLEHAVNWVLEHDTNNYDYICLLEPTSPFATYVDFDNAISLLSESGKDSLISVKEVDISSCFIHTLDEKGGLSNFYKEIIKMKSVRRQDQKKEYTLNGCIYCVKWDYFIKNRTIYAMESVPYIMSQEKSVDINNLFDVFMARSIVDNKLIDLSFWD